MEMQIKILIDEVVEFLGGGKLKPEVKNEISLVQLLNYVSDKDQVRFLTADASFEKLKQFLFVQLSSDQLTCFSSFGKCNAHIELVQCGS